jgi:hypothetical protein
MFITSRFGSRAQDHLSVGARWVLAAFQDAARACGLAITNCRWQSEDPLDDDDDDRYLLTFDSAGAADWEPFEASDLEDLSTSVRVRQSVEAQLQKLLARLGAQIGVELGSDAGQTGVRPA